MNRGIIRSILWVWFCLLYIQNLPVHAQITSWSTFWGSSWNTHSYPTKKPSHPSNEIQDATIELNATIQHGFISGDLMGDGQTQIAYVCKEPLSVVIVNLITGEIISVPLEKNVKDTIQSLDYLYIYELIEYDGEPGLEILCMVNSYKMPPLFEIVSPRKRTVIKTVYGVGGVDTNGDGIWDGQETDPKLFQAPSGKWKLFSHSSTERTDKVPRGLNVYDVATGEFESRLDTAGTGGWNSLVLHPEFGPLFLIQLITPDNGYSTIFDEKQVYDDEAFAMVLSYNENHRKFDVRWYQSLGKYLSGFNMVNRDPQGRYLACLSDYVIRPFDPEKPGAMHFFDFISGEVINTITMQPGISFNYFFAPEGKGEFFATIQEEPALVKIDIVKGLTARADFNSDPAARLAGLGVTDMDGDGKYDVIASLASKGKNYVLIFDSDLNEKLRISVPTLINSVAFADADQDGYPEMYYSDMRTNKRIFSMEYKTSMQSNVDEFLSYK